MKQLGHKKCILVISLIFLSLILSLLSRAYAGDGGAGPGGGNAVGDRFYDALESETLLPLDIKKTEAFIKYVSPVMTQLKAKLPEFGSAFERNVNSKRWFLDSKPFSEKRCLNETISGVKKDIIACQGETQIRLSRLWFESSKVPLQDKAAMIIHEILHSFPLAEYTIHELSVKLLSIHKYSEAEFIREVKAIMNEQSNLGDNRYYLTQAEICSEVVNLEQLAADELCRTNTSDENIKARLALLVYEEADIFGIFLKLNLANKGLENLSQLAICRSVTTVFAQEKNMRRCL